MDGNNLNPTGNPADVNQDGNIDAGDLLVIRSGGNWQTSASTARNPRADVNRDGVVNAGDLLAVRAKMFPAMRTATRTRGAAPLCVSFDGAQITSRDPGALWSFGDGKVSAGWIGAHVYTQPGEYLVYLRSGPRMWTQRITVDPPWPAIDLREGDDLYRVVSIAPEYTRILLPRGSRWTLDAPLVLRNQLLGAYGTGAKPRIESTMDKTNIRLLGSAIEGLLLSGGWGRNATGALIGGGGKSSFGLVHRCDMTGFGAAVGCANPILTHEPWVVGCNIINNNQAAWLGGVGGAMLDCHVQSAQTNAVRVFHARRFVIARNVIRDPRGDRLALKIHNAQNMNPPPAEDVIIGGNVLCGGDYTMSIAPQNRTSNEHLRNILVDSNLFESTARTRIGLLLAAQNVTAQNNTFDFAASTAGKREGVVIERQNGEPAPTGIVLGPNNQAINAALYRTPLWPDTKVMQ